MASLSSTVSLIKNAECTLIGLGIVCGQLTIYQALPPYRRLYLPSLGPDLMFLAAVAHSQPRQLNHPLTHSLQNISSSPSFFLIRRRIGKNLDISQILLFLLRFLHRASSEPGCPLAPDCCYAASSSGLSSF